MVEIKILLHAGGSYIFGILPLSVTLVTLQISYVTEELSSLQKNAELVKMGVIQ